MYIVILISSSIIRPNSVCRLSCVRKPSTDLAYPIEGKKTTEVEIKQGHETLANVQPRHTAIHDRASTRKSRPHHRQLYETMDLNLFRHGRQLLTYPHPYHEVRLAHTDCNTRSLMTTPVVLVERYTYHKHPY